ncbi:MAG: hypothetical protein JSV50_05210 [Desulfobacteraceae bacterium]|nr:MAG: hypothetical protein JSV50_05210 [Desulfobacteraceae bacterium]
MKKEGILLTIVVVLSAAGFAHAQDEIHGVADLTYQSKYIWRGFDIFGDKSAIQPSVNLDLFGTGFGVSITGHRANSSGYEEGERWDYNLYYGDKLFEDEAYAINWRLGWVYYNFPQGSSHSRGSADLQELHCILTWPNICPAGFVPSYVLVKLWPSNAGSLQRETSGFAHIFMLDYGMKVPGILPDTDEQVLRLHSELVFNDGVHPGGGNADHDWSNLVVGLETDFDLGNNMSLTPGLYQQISMDDSVNDEDETWVNLSLKYKF